VFAFIQKFALTTEDQLSFLGPVDIDGQSPQDAARAWVDANKDIWSAWFS